MLHESDQLQHVRPQNQAIGIQGQQIVGIRDDEIGSGRIASFQSPHTRPFDDPEALSHHSDVAVQVHRLVGRMGQVCVLLALEAVDVDAEQRD
jgi:hypothetical protein